jgi:KUP system potassium uptake protein
MERPDIPEVLGHAFEQGCPIQVDDVVYYVGHETVLGREDGKGLPRWVGIVFAWMERNSVHVTDFFRLPSDGVVEIGRQIAI